MKALLVVVGGGGLRLFLQVHTAQESCGPNVTVELPPMHALICCNLGLLRQARQLDCRSSKRKT